MNARMNDNFSFAYFEADLLHAVVAELDKDCSSTNNSLQMCHRPSSLVNWLLFSSVLPTICSILYHHFVAKEEAVKASVFSTMVVLFLLPGILPTKSACFRFIVYLNCAVKVNTWGCCCWVHSDSGIHCVVFRNIKQMIITH